MNIFHKVALQGLMRSRTRTIITIIGVILSAALLTGVTTFGISLLDYAAKGAAEKYGGWHIAFFDVPNDFVQERVSDESLLDASATKNIGYAILDDSQDQEKPYLFFSGYDEKAFQTLPVNLLWGRLPENGNEVIVSGSVQSRGGLELHEGSRITVELGDRMSNGRKLGQRDRFDAQKETFIPRESKTYTVVGMCQRPQYERASAPGFTMITRAENPQAADNYNVFVTLEKPYKVRTYLKNTAGTYAHTLNDEVLRFMGLSDDRIFTTLMFSVGGVVVAIIMIGSVFLIHNAFYISLNERMHQFGILLSVGATEKQLRHLVLFEGLCIGLAGIPFGILLGLCAIRAVIAVVARSFQGIMYSNPLVMLISPLAIAAAAVIALVTILISAYIPAKKAAAVPVMDCIRQTGEIQVRAGDVKVSGFAERVYGLEGMLALKNFKRNKRRYRSIVLSLVLSVVLFVSTNAFVIDLGQASEAAVVYTDIDLALSADGMGDDSLLNLYEQLKNVQGVTGGMYQEVRKYRCEVPEEAYTDAFRAVQGQGPLTLRIQFMSKERWQALLVQAGMGEADFTETELLCVAKIENHVNRLLNPDEFVDMFTSNTLDVVLTAENGSGQEKRVSLSFADIVPYDTLPEMGATEQIPYFMLAVAPWEMKPQFDALGGLTVSKGLTFQSETPSRSETEMREILSDEKGFSGYLLLNMSKMTELNTNMIFIANVFAYTFIIMISLIAAANVFHTISTNVRLRRRELAMLRSVGMSERAFRKMMNFECAFYGMQSLAFGVPASMLSAFLIYKGMYYGGADAISFVMPWGAIAVSIISVLLIVFVTMLYAVSKIRKENIIDALRDDMA